MSFAGYIVSPKISSELSNRQVMYMRVMRWVFLVVSVLVLLAIAIYVGYSYGRTPTSIPLTAAGKLREEALRIRLEASKTYYEVGLLLIGVLWGLVVLQREKPVVTRADQPEIWMFIVANLMAIGSLLSHYWFRSIVAQASWDALEGTYPDFFSETIAFPYNAQRWFLIGTLVVAAFTVISSATLRRSAAATDPARRANEEPNQ